MIFFKVLGRSKFGPHLGYAGPSSISRQGDDVHSLLDYGHGIGIEEGTVTAQAHRDRSVALYGE